MKWEKIQRLSFGCWNSLEVEPAVLGIRGEQAKVPGYSPVLLSHKTKKCTKCQNVIAESDDLFRLEGEKAVRYHLTRG